MITVYRLTEIHADEKELQKAQQIVRRPLQKGRSYHLEHLMPLLSDNIYLSRAAPLGERVKWYQIAKRATGREYGGPFTLVLHETKIPGPGRSRWED